MPAFVKLIRKKYKFLLTRKVSGENGVTWCSGSIRLEDERVMVVADIDAELSDDSSEYLTINLGSSAYEAASATFGGPNRLRVRQALIGFCIEVAAAIGVVGFRLCFVDDRKSPLAEISLLESILSRDGMSLIQGIASSEAAAARIRNFWGRQLKESGGYLVLITI